MNEGAPKEETNNTENSKDALNSLQKHMRTLELRELKILAKTGETEATQLSASEELSRRAKLGAKKRALKKAEKQAQEEEDAENLSILMESSEKETPFEKFTREESERLRVLYASGYNEDGEKLPSYDEDELETIIAESADKYANAMIRLQERMKE